MTATNLPSCGKIDGCLDPCDSFADDLFTPAVYAL